MEPVFSKKFLLNTFPYDMSAEAYALLSTNML